MNDEYDELYDMLSNDTEAIKKIKESYKEDISYYLNKIKNYQITNIDISQDYDLENDFDKFKIADIDLKYNLDDECLNYKISLLSGYLEDLAKEKRFLEFKRSKKDLMSKQEYQEYLRNEIYRNDILSKWYKEFLDNE